GYELSRRRADLRSVDVSDVLLEWEFKLFADALALGQILVYVALARREQKRFRRVRGVIAAFGFAEELQYAIETMNLGIELVEIPESLRWGGSAPLFSMRRHKTLRIPRLNVPRTS